MASMAGSYVAPLLTATGPVVPSTLTADKSRAFAKTQNRFEILREARRLRRKLERSELVLSVAMASIGCLAMLTGLAAMYIEESVIVSIAFLFPILIAPYSFYQRYRLNRMPSLVDEINKARSQANTLAELRIRLSQETDRLAVQVGRLPAAEKKLQEAVQETGGDVNEFQRLVRENGETTRKIKKLQDAQEVQHLFEAVLQSDVNGDLVLSEREMEELLLRLQTFSSLPMDTEGLREKFRMSDKESTTTLFRLTADHMVGSRDLEDDEDDNAGCISYFHAMD